VHRFVLALGLSALLWAAAVPSAPVPLDAATTTASAEACAVAGESPDRDSSRQWRNAHHAIAVVTESVWKSAPVHAELGATRITRLFEIACSVTCPDPPAASAPHYLRHTPLLI